MKVSIVIPAYNEEENIESTIKSLLNQTYKNFEITVVDNNSKDRTKEIAERYVRTVTETKQGYIHAVIRGIQETDGEIIAVCDADSIYSKKWLEKMVKHFKDPEIVAVYGTAYFKDTNVFMKILSYFVYTIFLVYSKLRGLDNTAGFNFVYRRDAYNKVGGYDPNWKWASPDIDLGKRLKKVGKLKLVLVAVGSSSRRFKKNGYLKTAKMFLNNWKDMLKKDRPEVSYDEYNKTSK